ncbi:uncharacterized protein LOC108101911 isoform X3 [Drosophila ficusphila]|uniref:uncharacterized protein LOC108101911 isoform X3 n=1 Tax=Drosophila ficusphila TaxID=30025 RepID=UPI0007E7988D|nr:uncharacterized protein LOC108101911 isoform X3 [Drosophila ficusphila]
MKVLGALLVLLFIDSIICDVTSEIITNGKINQSGFNTAAEDAEKAKPCKAIEDPDRCELAYKFEECVKEQLNFSFFS